MRKVQAWDPPKRAREEPQGPAKRARTERTVVDDVLEEMGVVLDPRQRLAVEWAARGHSMFLTGSAGCGKSLVTRCIVAVLERMHTDARVGVTSSTGVSAINIGGVTVHSWTGVGIGDKPLKRLVPRKGSPAHQNITDAAALIVDEVSMLKAELIDKIDGICRAVRATDAPFGGIQVVLVGDFFQLPPVAEDGEEKGFVFTAKVWKELRMPTIVLSRVFRQSDPALVDALNHMRKGEWNDHARALVERCRVPFADREKAVAGEAVRLFTHRKPAEDVNARRLAQLDPATERTFTAKDTGKEGYMNKCRAPLVLKLRVGASVMFVVNDSNGRYANGTQGVVEGYNGEGYPRVRTQNGVIVARPHKWSVKQRGREIAVREQVPLDLAWAITVHKSQGATFEKVILTLGRAFEAGQAYVGLSRCTSEHGMLIETLNERNVYADPDVLAFYARVEAETEAALRSHTPM